MITLLKTERLNIGVLSDDEMQILIDNEPVEELKAAYGEMLALCRANPAGRAWYAAWSITLPSGERVGDLGFKGLSADGVTEIGYGLLPAFWGHGYATEAVTAAVLWAAAQPGVRRIEAETDADNAASKRVLEKAGFVPTGTIGEEGPRFVWIPQRKDG